MYAVISSGGKQYKVQQGDVLRFEKSRGRSAIRFLLTRCLCFPTAIKWKSANPLENAAVRGHIVEQGKAKKILVFKYKRRKRYRRKQGHRQQYTAIRIDSIEA